MLKTPPSSAKPAAIDIFCGAGGLSYGLLSSGLPVCAGIDIDPDCRYPFSANLHVPFLQEDLSNLSPDSLKDLFPKDSISVIAGCAPCQPFSTLAQGHSDHNERWTLLLSFCNLISRIQPQVIAMENVPSLSRHKIYKSILKTLEQQNYHFSATILPCADYGVPQHRTRLILLASKLGPISMVQPTSYRDQPTTVRQAIGHLPPLKAGAQAPLDPLHCSSTLSPTNQERIKHSRPGRTWRDWPAELKADCHVRETGKYCSSFYGRMLWDQPAPTITTRFNGYGNGRFGHPEQDRAISLREGALLQTFPESYSFLPDPPEINIQSTARMIGNAVPVKLGEAIGRSILLHLENLQQ